MSDTTKEVPDYKKIALIFGLSAMALISGLYLVGVFTLPPATKNQEEIRGLLDDVKTMPEIQLPEIPEIKIENPFEDKVEDPVNVEALKAAEEEEKLKQNNEFKKTEFLQSQEINVAGLVQKGFDKQIVEQILLADCGILTNGTAFPTLNQTQNLSENGTVIESPNELLEYKKELCS